MLFQFNMQSGRPIRPGAKWKWLLLFVGFPLLELWLILKLSAVMGWGATIWLILMTGFMGGTLAHRQGFTTLQKIQRDMAQGRMPAGALLDGLLILVAGLLLITPGIITDHGSRVPEDQRTESTRACCKAIVAPAECGAG